MLLRLSNIVHLSMRNVRLIPMALALALTMASAGAQAQTWQVDSEFSVARLSVGSERHASEIGLARVSGQMVFDSDHPANSTVDLKIAPGNEAGSQNVGMSFISKQSAMTGDGKLIVTGNLAVTWVERSTTTMDPSEAFAGAANGEPIIHTAVHPLTLVFYLPRQSAAIHATTRISGTASVARRDFPQLFDAFMLADWPAQLVNGQKCTLPLTVGEDYSGTTCTGTLIASVSNAEVRVGNGEAFSGFRPAVVPDFDRGTIAMDVRLTEIEPAP